MPIITITTDFGEKDFFTGAVKGAIYAEIENIKIVDISHGISPFHITEAAYVIENAYKRFPKNTIHIIGVDAELTPENKHIAVLLDGHYFICANNGIISMLTNKINPEQVVEITIHNHISSNFPVLDVFVKVACHLARGGKLDVIGKSILGFLPEKGGLKQLTGLNPVINPAGNQLKGTIIYIDNYGNVVCNITKKLFEDVGKGRPFIIRARTATFKEVFSTYSEAIHFDKDKNVREEDGKKIAIWNSSGYLELAIYKSNPSTVGSASTLFGLGYRDMVTIQFEAK